MPEQQPSRPSSAPTTFARPPVPTLIETLRYFVRLVRMVHEYWGSLARSMILGLIIGLFGMIVPYVSKLLIDNAYPARDIGLMHVLVIGVAVLTLGSLFMGLVQGYFASAVTARLGSATSMMFFNHLQHLRMSFFDEHRVGEVLSRFGDVRNGLGMVSSVFQTLLTNGVYLVIVPPFLLLLNWKLTLLSIVVLPITAAISTVSSRLVRKLYKQNAEASAELGAYQYEVFSHIRTLKSMALESHVYARIEEQTHGVLRLSMRATRLQSFVGLANGVIRAGGTLLFSWYAWTLIINNELSLGSFVAFTSYLGYLTGPLTQFSSLFTTIQQAAVSLGRMFEYLDITPEQAPSLAYVARPPIRQPIGGDLAFEHVFFHYNPERPVLEDICFTIPRGAIVALVGESGAGKSSLLRMIPRLVDPIAGRITIDGRSAYDFALPDLRRQVAVVWQEVSLMRGTVLENLTMGNAAAPMIDVMRAIDVCQLSDLIASLPNGLESSVAEWGATLSGGQRQRLAIARALVRDTPILLLDEATANVDVGTEDKLLNCLFETYRGRTIVFVTHRVATATRADLVCVLAKGRVVGTGSPEYLTECNPYFQSLLSAAGIGPNRSPEHRRPALR